MNRLAGQAGSTLAQFAIRAGMAFMTVFFIAVLAAGGLAYRLSLGPLQIPWAATRLANMVSGEDVAVRIGRAELTWSGYHSGSRAPVFLQLGDIQLRNTSGALLATIPQAQLAFSLRAFFTKHSPIYVNGQNAQVMDSDAPVSLLAGIRLGPAFTLSSADLFVTFGAGRLGPPGYDEPLIGGKFQLTITPNDVRLDHATLTLQPFGRSAPVVQIAASAHKSGSWRGAITLSTTAVQAADVPHYWPSQLATGTRNWVTQNITAGTAQDAHFTLGVNAPPHLATVNIDSATGGFTAGNVTLAWLPRVQPITDLAGKFTLADRDDIDIAADTGHLGGITLTAATMHIAGVSKKSQLASLSIPLHGTLQDVLGVLNGPGLGLLKTVPQIATATGGMTGIVRVTLPLNVSSANDVRMNVAARLTNVTLPLPVQGLCLQQGNLSVDATLRNLNVKGDARLAGQPASLAAAASFGSAAAVTFDMQTTATAATLQDLGLDSGGLIQGAMPVSVHVATTSAAGGNFTVDADLAGAALALPVFGWNKPAGAPGYFSFAASLTGGDFTAIEQIERIDATAPGLDVGSTLQGRAIVLKHARIGNTEGSGRITPPAGAGQPWIITLRGNALDLSSQLNGPHKTVTARPETTGAAKRTTTEPQPLTGFLWNASAQFGRLLLANDPAPALQDFTFNGSGQGDFLFRANAAAAVAAAPGAATAVTLTVTPAPNTNEGNSETLLLHSADAGTLLRAMGAFENLSAGKLDVAATYGAAAPFKGFIKISNFRMLNAPSFGKILQALTVLGIPEAASGPGLLFNRLIVPFSIDDPVITLKGARAYSAALGFTASGTIDLDTSTYDIQGTVVPAYALNSLPGKIPLIGKLFSPEKGGGLFAMRYSMRGPIADPKVTINPLSALTPGFLRGIFGTK